MLRLRRKLATSIAKVQEVQVYKRLKYKQRYKDQAQGKALMYPLEVSVSRGDQIAFGSLAFDAPFPIAASVATIEDPQDPPVGTTTMASLAESSSGIARASLQGSMSAWLYL